MTDGIIRIVAAVIRDRGGRMLLVRKRGTSAFMQPGGKPDAGEDNLTALARELHEELGCRVHRDSAQSLGVFECVAANEPGFRVHASVYSIEVDGAIEARAEIDEVLWVDPRALPNLPLAPLTRDHIMPLTRLS